MVQSCFVGVAAELVGQPSETLANGSLWRSGVSARVSRRTFLATVALPLFSFWAKRRERPFLQTAYAFCEPKAIKVVALEGRE